MMTRCPTCKAELGPAEDPAGCLTCQGRRLATNPDRVVAVLEQSDMPLAHWDVKRLLEANGHGPVNKGSLLVWLSQDARPCWGGPGIYGLYRHGLLPTVRDLGSTAAVFVHATEADITQEEINFLLQHVGYRFQSTSMHLALRRAEADGLIRWNHGGWTKTGRSVGPVLGIRRRADVDAVMERATAQARAALAERARRLR